MWLICVSLPLRGANLSRAQGTTAHRESYLIESFAKNSQILIEILHWRLQQKGSCVKCKPLRIKVSGIRPSSWSHASQWSNAEVARGIPREAAGL